MGLLETSSNLFWDKNVSPITTSMYNETASRKWSVSDFELLNDKTEWLSISFNEREDLILGLLISNTIKQAFGAVLLSLLGTAIPIQELAAKSMISTIESKLSGEHCQLISLMITELNSPIAILKAKKELLKLKELGDILDTCEDVYAAMYGWTAACAEGVEHPDFDVFNELHYSIWQSAALAIIMLGVADTVAMASLFNLKEKGYDLPEMTKGVRLMAKDISLMTTYITMVADNSFIVLPEPLQEKAKQWLQGVVSQEVISAWSDTSSNFLEEENRKLSNELFKYNVNKTLVTLRFYPKEKIDGMPKVIQKHLLVDTNKWFEEGKEKFEKRSRRRWW